MNNLKIGWKTQTIEGLEKVKWAHLQTDTPLIKRIKELRKTPLDTFTTEDLRIAKDKE